MPIANYHTHIYLCKHATGTIEEYILKAIDNNYQILGISDHGPIDDQLTKLLNSRRMSMDEYYNIYLKDLEQLKIKYQDKITLLRAAEVEFYADYITRYRTMHSELDYLVLGQHEILRDGKYKSVYYNLDEKDIMIYAETVCEAMNTKLFKIVAHPELFMYSLKEFNNVCEKASRMIIECAIKNNIVLEINANGIRRPLFKGLDYHDEKNYVYPYPEFWKLVHEYQQHSKLDVVINDDSHSLIYFNDECTKLAYEFAERYKIKVLDKISFL